MEFTQSVTYPTDVRGVVEMSLDGDYVHTRFAPACSGDVKIVVEDRTITATGSLRPELIPAVARAVVSGSVSFTFVERWIDTATGAKAVTSLKCSGAPITLDLESTVAPDGSGSTRNVHGALKVSVPFFGNRIEKEAVSRAELAVKAEEQLAQTWIDSHNV